MFDSIKNNAVLVSTSVLKLGKPVLFIARYNDGILEFTNAEENLRDDPIHVISLDEIMEIDPALSVVGTLDSGFCLIRADVNSPWEKFNLGED